ncbi:protein of unknown function [Paenibacillus sophorae]|uniref:DUF4177 domain-containing protein n=2 Tax=Paenibacillus TaxID=44249 RepID=A0A089HV64_PAEDU|nr:MULTISPECIES: DUF4177 domain-containing protein [Paenibacillus]AIQ14967.1 hypothetical protein PDUR_26140 [Paenibacillus durus]QWU15996.1 DUF4177 domain-containing protein [Paenibacillus sophorae]SEN69023.1 protein of unknown function [Paenibacillus sophorae]
MYKYEFVSISVGTLSGKLKEDYRQVIEQHSARGWKLHSIVPMPVLAGGQVSTLELIFERFEQ